MPALEPLLSWVWTQLHPPQQADVAPAVFLCSGKVAVQSSHRWQILSCAFPFLCALSAFQPRNPRASLKSMRWEITSLPPFPFGPALQWSSASRLGRAVTWIRRGFPFPARCPLSWHTRGPAPAHRDPSTTLLLPGLDPNQVQTAAEHPAWLAQSSACSPHVPHMHRGGLWEKGQEQAPLDLAEVHLAFDFLTGSDFG